MSDDPRVTVPTSNHAIPTGVWIRRELVDALADLFYHWDNASENGIPFDVQRFVPAARALVDAAERPDEGETERLIEGPPGYGPITVKVPIQRQSCLQCGSDEGLHTCPAPPPVPVSDEAEAEKKCGAIHPSNDSVIPCQLQPFHEGGHYSTTGCAGGGFHWSKELAELIALRHDADRWRNRGCWDDTHCRAQAWQEGYSAGANDQYAAELGELEFKTANPYFNTDDRAARQAGEDEQP